MARFFMFVFVCALLVFVAYAQPSTPSTCVSPTWFIYNSPNCRGTVNRQPLYTSNLCPRTCGSIYSSSNSGNYTCGGTRVASNVFYQSQCRGPSVYSTITTQECINYRGVSAALVCRLDDPIYPPHSSATPTAGDGNLKAAIACPQPYYCTPEVPFVTYFADHQCRGNPFSSWEFHEGAKLDKCYYDATQRLNTKYECDLRDLQLTQRTFAHGCDKPEFSYNAMPLDTCILNGSTGYGMIFYCGSTSKRTALQQAWEALSQDEQKELQAMAQEAYRLHGEKLANPFATPQLP